MGGVLCYFGGMDGVLCYICVYGLGKRMDRRLLLVGMWLEGLPVHL
jgi:hypothetical protein